MSTMTPAELAKLSTESLTFLLGLAEEAAKALGEHPVVGTIKTILASREAAEAKEQAAFDARRWIFQDNDIEIRVVAREYSYDDRKNYNSNTRIYVDLWNDADIAEAHAALPEPKIKGEDAENDKAYATFNRRYSKMARQIAAYALEVAEAHDAIHAEKDVKLSYSRYAGCSCPCSPGVKADKRLRTKSGNEGFDIWVTVKR